MHRDRLRAALTELGLLIGGLLFGVVVLMIARTIGVWPASSVRGFGILAGPVITTLAAVGYRFVARRMGEAEVGAPAASPVARAGLGDSLAIAVIGIGLALGGSMALGALLELVGVPASEQAGILEIIEDARTGTDRTSIAVLAFSAIVLAPIAEEWLFRGLLFTRVRAVAGRIAALVVSAPAFAVIHANPSGLVIYVWLGVVFALALERSGRLPVAMAVHMGNNAVAFGLLVFGLPQ